MAESKAPANKKLVANILSMTSMLMGRMSWMARAGLQFQGKRDLYAVFGWKTYLRYQDFLIKYVRQGAATRIIDAPVNATWIPQPTLKADDAFTTAWKALNKTIPLFGILTRADRLAGLGRFSIIVLGFDGTSGPDDLATPVPTGARKLLYATPFGEDCVGIVEFEKDTSNPRYGKPLMYTVNMADPSSMNPMAAPNSDIASVKLRLVKIHWSRIIHIAEATLEDEIFAVPRLMPVYNDLDDLMKVSGGSAETFWLNSNRGMQVDVDKEMELDPAEAANLEQEVQEYQHELRRVMRTRGVKINPLGSDVPNPQGTYRMIISNLSMTTGIPSRILIGSEAGQLASQEDRANWTALVGNRRLSFAEPYVLFPLINRLVAYGVLPEPKDLEIIWADVFNLSPLEQAQTMAQFARSAVNLSKQCLNDKGQPTTIVTTEEARIVLGLPGKPEVKPEANMPAPGSGDNQQPPSSATDPRQAGGGN